MPLFRVLSPPQSHRGMVQDSPAHLNAVHTLGLAPALALFIPVVDDEAATGLGTRYRGMGLGVIGDAHRGARVLT
jgi:hypothetical protein